MARSKPVLNAVEFKNNIGQIIRPGDDVIIVTTCTSSVYIKPGTYLGKKNDGVSCRVTEHRTRYRHKETGKEVDTWFNDSRIKYPSRDYSVKYGTPEYEIENERFNQAYKEYNDAIKEVCNEYDPFKVPYDRYTTLQLNRIYKIDTSVFDLSI